MVVTLHPKSGLKARLSFLLVMLFVKPLLILFPIFDAGLRQLKWLDRGRSADPTHQASNGLGSAWPTGPPTS
ncbi:Putative hydrolase/esterase/lipase [Mycobacteroides abscessus]|nr:Putative hydrolase/esterase/lipase [Mycobacteroides abscessus]